MTTSATAEKPATAPQAGRQVPFFNYPALFAEHREEYLSTFEDVLQRGAYIMQRDLAEFEEALARYLGVKHAIGVADGTVALKIALTLAGVGPGDEVIVPSHTFIATAAAVHQVGATPVLCDCGPDSMIDVDSARHVLSSRTKAIMPVQLNGRTCDMDKVEAFAAEHGLKIVEDSCQAMGAKYRGRFAGTFGVAGSFSFFPAKTLGCFGDGGGLILEDDALAEQARELRDHGRGKDGKVHRFGINGRLDNIQAAILSVKLKRYDESIDRRRALARIYDARLSTVAELLLPPGPDSDPLRFDIFQNYEIQSERRDALREFLTARGVGTIMQWGGHMIHQFEDLNLKAHAPYAEEMSRRYMMLPLHPMLSDDDAHYVCDQIETFYNG
ncbi:DegT/DnrJ/EryC1/StrS family aminotransferase [Caulobacter mirabilis]|uniref:Cell wall biogenesis protein n=1 Tax=Caulobacter mirabilis TaxID=69666 RepID=A0A2D2AT20_9CAUL|nr:DegT/DnrJ/EryC1/StrS family aminotransferase [Caulobacter mirabilis]ATQ41136.1 cell wall biogenesis protein [Caulobacter mirabilis]